MSPHCVTIWIHIQLSIAIHFNPSVASDCRFRWARRAKTTPVHMLHVFISTSINRVNIQDKLFEMIFWKALFHLHLLIYPPPAPQLALKKNLTNLVLIRIRNTCGANVLRFHLIELLIENLSTSLFDKWLAWRNQWYSTYLGVNVIPRCEFSH